MHPIGQTYNEAKKRVDLIDVQRAVESRAGTWDMDPYFPHFFTNRARRGGGESRLQADRAGMFNRLHNAGFNSHTLSYHLALSLGRDLGSCRFRKEVFHEVVVQQSCALLQ